MASQVKQMFYAAGEKLLAEAQQLGHTVRYRMHCGTDGTPSVAQAVLPTRSADATFSTIVSDVRAKGFAAPTTKYWIWYDGGISAGYSGQGGICSDDVLSLANCHNGTGYGVTYGAGWHTMMHENAHNMGAVQMSAPHSSGAWHCNDDWDIMCYPDGGPTSRMQTLCNDTEHFDCGHDDYFNPAPALGTYLYDHWNIGSCFNRFVSIGSCESGLPPIAFAGSDITLGPSLPTNYRPPPGTASDPDVDLFSYEWSWVGCTYTWGSDSCPTLNGSSGSLSGGDQPVPSPEFYVWSPGTYELKLAVMDRATKVGQDRVVIEVR